MTLRQGPGKDKSVQNPGSATRGPAVVVAPLIALQKNQLDGLRSVSYTHLTLPTNREV